ncbi:MAG: type II toxin-antitoxin system prevent-host-death family antitoxin [Thiotrichales bacterium]|nr:type II toxin-antitoxin system prevent-host-death family antitoxin [Thiotrichales bacterium]
MQIVAFSEARQNLKTVIDRVVNDVDFTIITRAKSQENAVLMSQKHFEGLMETVHLLSSTKNANWLAESIEQHKSGKIETKELIDV